VRNEVKGGGGKQSSKKKVKCEVQRVDTSRKKKTALENTSEEKARRLFVREK